MRGLHTDVRLVGQYTFDSQPGQWQAMGLQATLGATVNAEVKRWSLGERRAVINHISNKLCEGRGRGQSVRCHSYRRRSLAHGTVQRRRVWTVIPSLTSSSPRTFGPASQPLCSYTCNNLSHLMGSLLQEATKAFASLASAFGSGKKGPKHVVSVRELKVSQSLLPRT